MPGRVLIVGGGGREHALAWRFARSPSVDEVVVAPGNAGTATERCCRNHPIDVSDIESVVRLAQSEAVDLVVVGPEDPLVAGLVDALNAVGIVAFGPVAAAARLEGSKHACKQFLEANQIPTAQSATFTDIETARRYLGELGSVPVVKASGLAAGKGVVVAESIDEADAALQSMLVDSRFGEAGAEVLLEERLVGTEISVLAFCDGVDYHLMPAAQDHKRLRDADQGPNTGGMGAFVPSPVADAEFLDEVGRTVIAPTLAALAAEGTPYRGVLYAGMMLTDDGLRVLEFNCRFGDPETQVVMPLLKSDPYELFKACAAGSLADVEIEWHHDAAATVVLASAGYPVSSSAPEPISGLDDATASGAIVFHAGTAMIDGVVHATGGRVLAVTAVAESLDEAVALAHSAASVISFTGAQRRKDIGRGNPGHNEQVRTINPATTERRS